MQMKPMRALVLAVAALAIGAAHAQEPITIAIGGQIVARVREKGRFESVAARTSQIEKWIADVISYEDTQNPKLTLARKDGVLHIYCAKRPVIDVYPADAAASNTTEMALAQMWLKNIKAALPRATPVSRLPAAPPTPSEKPPAPPVAPVVEKPPTGAAPVTDVSPTTPGASTTPTGETLPPPVEGEDLPTPAKTPRSAALLMVLATLDLVRAVPEQEYLDGRDGIASNLLENLEPFMAQARAGGEASGTPQPPRPPLGTGVTPFVPKPLVIETPTTGGGGAVLPRVPTVPGGPSVPTPPPAGTVKPPALPTTGDASTARVPQKQRISRKFGAAEKPFLALKAAGDPKAAEVSELLKESRAAYTDGDFDTSEAKVDEALRMMGVPIPQ